MWKISDFLRKLYRRFKLLWKEKQIKIDIITDNKLIIPEYIINFKNKSKKTLELVEHFEKLRNLTEQKNDNKIIELKDKENFKKPFRKKIL